MSVTIKQVIIGTVVGGTVVGLAVLRLRKENPAPLPFPDTTQVAVLKVPGHKKHANPHETDVSTRKLYG